MPATRRLLLLLVLFAPPLHAQQSDSALSDAEVEKIREAAPLYSDRVLLFAGFLDDRTKDILALTNGRKKPGRDADLHDLMEQFSSIANDLEDNLADYGPRHRDLRKALPKLLSATERWQSALKTPPENSAYEVSRKLALEAVADLRDDATHLVTEQKEWFQAHPPTKADEKAPGRQ